MSIHRAVGHVFFVWFTLFEQFFLSTSRVILLFTCTVFIYFQSNHYSTFINPQGCKEFMSWTLTSIYFILPLNFQMWKFSLTNCRTHWYTDSKDSKTIYLLLRRKSSLKLRKWVLQTLCNGFSRRVWNNRIQRTRICIQILEMTIQWNLTYRPPQY